MSRKRVPAHEQPTHIKPLVRLSERVDAQTASLSARIDAQGAHLNERIDAQGASLSARIDSLQHALLAQTVTTLLGFAGLIVTQL